ncbi:hypothetical protein M569_08212 [Genlisea aurea]|uniref:Uncharacterized protein n=1 Tax=Genlisea aurea TaxID=192259 RepID=S8CIK8_9LAMI|nr:hypothetical protein M569_08212 [Genlisea aurea]
MEIPEIHMITDLQNPGFSLFSQLQRWWKFGALVLAILATFRSLLIKRSRLILIISRSFRAAPNRIEEIVGLGDDDFDSDDASSEEDARGGERIATTSYQSQRRRSEEFGVKGSRFSFKGCCGGGWGDFNPGKNVVNFWDSLGLSLDFDEDLFDFDDGSVVATWESSPPEPSPLVLTAEGSVKRDGVIQLSGYDSRIRRRSPALYAEWSSSPTEKITAVTSDGVGKVYVRDDINGVLTVGDVRKVGRPLKTYAD